MWDAKTPCYFYVTQELNPIDPLMIHALNIFKTTNRLTEVRIKDIRHGSLLRQLSNKYTMMEAHQKITKKMESQNELINKGITESIEYIDNKTKYYREKHKKDVNLSPSQKSYILLEHLKQLQLLDDKEYSNFLYKVENNELLFEDLVDEIKERQYVSVAEPLAENIEDFLQDLSEQDADSIEGYVKKMRNNRKGIKEQTPKAIKQHFSSLLIGGIIMSATVVPYLISLIGFYNMDVRIIALSAVALIIALGRYHYPMFLPPIALVFYPNHVLRPYKIRRGSRYFILNDRISNIYNLNNKQRWMWDGKLPCYMFEGKPGSETEILVAKTITHINHKKKEKKVKQSKPIKQKPIVEPITETKPIKPTIQETPIQPEIIVPVMIQRDSSVDAYINDMPFPITVEEPIEKPTVPPIIETKTIEQPTIDETESPIDPKRLKLYPDDLLIKVYEKNLKKEGDESRELVLKIHSELIKRHEKRSK